MLITPRVIRNRDEAKIVTSDFKAGLEKVRAELERLMKDRERLLPPRPLPPLRIRTSITNTISSSRSRSRHRLGRAPRCRRLLAMSLYYRTIHLQAG